MQNKVQASSWDADLSQIAMGETFCFPISRLVSAEKVKVPPPKIASNFQVRRYTSYPAEGERSGNNNILRASPSLSGSLV